MKSKDQDNAMDEFAEKQRIATAKLEQDPLPATPKEARMRLQSEIAEHDLARHVADLEIQGYTILPPGRGAPTDLTDNVREAISRIAQQQASLPMDTPSLGLGSLFTHLLPQDRAIQQAVMNPVTLALCTYLVGYRARLSQSTAIIKTNENDTALAWHTDLTSKLPAPWPLVSQTANVSFALTDYDRANGALCFVPGSHQSCTPPPVGFSHDHEDVEVVEVPAGSAIVWHSNLWHAALPRTAEGKRITLVLLFMRPHMSTQEDYAPSTTAEMLELNPARLGVLTGVVSPLPTRYTEFYSNLGRWT